MTLLSVCQDVADVVGFTRPTAIITAQDQLSRQMLGFAKECLEELTLMNWPCLEVPYSFTTVVGQQQYSLPADWGNETGDSVFDSSVYYQMRGSLSPADWARQRNALPSELGRLKFRIFGQPPMINITPTPETTDDISLEYRTTYQTMSTGGGYNSTYVADTDVPLVPEKLVYKGLKWRIRRAKGLDYTEEFNDYELSRQQRLSQALQMGSMPVAYRSLLDNDIEQSNPYIPLTGFGV